ncbi:hypothetical protein D9M68_886830 [compost metagenome]
MAAFHGGGDHLADVFFNDGRGALVDQLHLGPVRIDADDFVSIRCQATSRDGTHITQTKDTDSHRITSSIQCVI